MVKTKDKATYAGTVFSPISSLLIKIWFFKIIFDNAFLF